MDRANLEPNSNIDQFKYVEMPSDSRASEDHVRALLNSYAEKHVLTKKERDQLHLEEYRLRRQGRRFILLLPMASDLADKWVLSVIKREKAKDKPSTKEVGFDNRPFYRPGLRLKISLESLKKRLWKSTRQIAKGEVLLEKLTTPLDAGPTSLFSMHLLRLKRLFAHYKQGKLSEKDYSKLLDEGRLGLEVCDQSFGTGSVYLRDLDFEEILEKVGSWDKEIRKASKSLEKIADSNSIKLEKILKLALEIAHIKDIHSELKVGSKRIFNKIESSDKLELQATARVISKLENESLLPFRTLSDICKQVTDIEARRLVPVNKLMEYHSLFVISRAKKLRKRRAIPGKTYLGDAAGYGAIGLRHGIRRFDPGLENQPSTYLRDWVEQVIRRRVSTEGKSEIMTFGMLSSRTDQETYDISYRFEEAILKNYDEEIDKAEAIKLVRQVLRDRTVLDHTEKEVLVGRFGLNGGDVKTYDVIAKSLGFDRESARQRYLNSIIRLRIELRKRLAEQDPVARETSSV